MHTFNDAVADWYKLRSQEFYDKQDTEMASMYGLTLQDYRNKQLVMFEPFPIYQPKLRTMELPLYEKSYKDNRR